MGTLPRKKKNLFPINNIHANLVCVKRWTKHVILLDFAFKVMLDAQVPMIGGGEKFVKIINLLFMYSYYCVMIEQFICYNTAVGWPTKIGKILTFTPIISTAPWSSTVSTATLIILHSTVDINHTAQHHGHQSLAQHHGHQSYCTAPWTSIISTAPWTSIILHSTGGHQSYCTAPWTSIILHSTGGHQSLAQHHGHQSYCTAPWTSIISTAPWTSIILHSTMDINH